MAKRNRGQQHQHAFLSEEPIISKKRNKPSKRHQDEEKLISSGMSEKILREAQLQQKEIEDEERSKAEDPFAAIADDPEAVSTVGDDEIDEFQGFSDTETQYGNYDEEVNEEDERILEAFMSKDAGPQPTLAQIIINKMRETDEQVSSEARPLPKLDTAIIDLYKGVGKLMNKYTAGKIPKAFKHIPSLKMWEDVLYLTEPEKWSHNAMYQATRIFCSNMPAKKVQRFYSLVLLPRVREDIRKNKRLHFGLYQALKKSVYKPAAFHKGILFPLCESGTCSLREAVIIGSIIQKVSIPPLHSSAALMKLAKMEYCGTTSYFIRILLDKKYALPYHVLDAVAAHFMKFLDYEKQMPVIWHLSLLIYVQRYKHELTKEDKDNLHKLLQRQKHDKITSEIRRELSNSRSRGEKDLSSNLAPLSIINKPIEEDRFDLPDVPMEED